MVGKANHEGRAQFTQPVRQITMMLVVLILVALGGYVAFPAVAPVFLANPWLNGFIAMVFLIGIVACFWQVFQLSQSVNWIEGFVSENPGHEFVKAPRLLAPLAALLRSRGRQMQISASSSRSIQDSVATRIDEARDITRYIVNLLIFLGLLGTFYGLATTVPAIVETIRGLAPQQGEDGMQVFARLMSGLEAQLGGMGVAFSSSLLGLAGSLVVGLLELFASHGQNRFYRELEEWLSSITRLGYAGAGDGDGQSETGMVAAVLDYMSQQMDQLQTMFAEAETSRAMVDERLGALATSIERMTQRMQVDGAMSDALDRVARGQERLADVFEAQAETGGGMDAESRMRMRSIDVQLLRLLEEVAAGRQETTNDLRNDIKVLIRAVRGQGLRGDLPAAEGKRG